MATKDHRIFVDMDGVIVDFDSYAKSIPDMVKSTPGAYLNMLPIPGAIKAIRSLIGMGYDVWLATRPPTGIAGAYGDKAQWVFNWLPELKRKLILTHDKGLLGCENDFLIDDRPHKANCESFTGTLIVFGEGGHNWESVLTFFKILRDEGAPSKPKQDVLSKLLTSSSDGAEVSEAELVCYETYAVMGGLLSLLDLDERGELVDVEKITKLLDNLSEAKLIHKDVLPLIIEDMPHSLT
jgi:5'(3')-deoxyribonucleotidase